FFAVKLIFSIAAFSTILLFALTIVSGLLPGILVKVEEDFINRLVAFRNTANMQDITISYLLVALVLLLEWLVAIVSKYLYVVNRESIRKNVYKKMFSAVENMAFDKLEAKVNQDLIARVFKRPEMHLSTLIKNILLLLKYS
ncbi:MAG TPA: hypothetical protein DCZ20_05620, partial [Lachnospiraceae bacterium]|nr:hypothetical protein [Lachnospiraceae bacterium]